MNWIAIYTRSRHECTVARQLQKMGYEVFVPMRRELHQWSDRKHFVNVPLIPSYVFIKIQLNLYYRIYEVSGVVRIIMFNGRIAIIKEEEIEMLRKVENCKKLELVSTKDFKKNDKVEIVNGKFIGLRGSVVNIRDSRKVGIIIEEIGYTIIVDKEDIQLIQKRIEVDRTV